MKKTILLFWVLLSTVALFAQDIITVNGVKYRRLYGPTVNNFYIADSVFAPPVTAATKGSRQGAFYFKPADSSYYFLSPTGSWRKWQTGGGSMVYPSAGIGYSNGSAWASSLDTTRNFYDADSLSNVKLPTAKGVNDFVRSLIGVSSGQNFANTNLSFTANRTHNAKGFSLLIDSLTALDFKLYSGSTEMTRLEMNNFGYSRLVFNNSGFLNTSTVTVNNTAELRRTAGSGSATIVSADVGRSFMNTFNSSTNNTLEIFADSGRITKPLHYFTLDTSAWNNRTLVTKNYINQRLSSLPIGSGVDSGAYRTITQIDATRISLNRLNGTSDTLNTNASGGSLLWGTYAERVAITSPANGAIFTQTNEIIGNYVYINGAWEFQMPASYLYKYEPGKGTAGLGTATIGSGAEAAYQQNTTEDSIYSHHYQLSTGVSTTGLAMVASVGASGADFHSLPLDSNYAMVLTTSIKIKTAQDATNNYHFRFGTGSGNVGDYPYGLWFVSDFDSSGAAIQTLSKDNGSLSTFFTTSTNMSSLDSQFVTFTIVANTTVAKYYINGVLVREQRTNIPNQRSNTLWTLQIKKRTGTTARTIALRSLLCYITRKPN